LLLAGAAHAQGTPQLLYQENGPNNSEYGWATNGIGADVDSDGLPDHLVGAPKNDPTGTAQVGSVFVMSGTGALIRRHDGTANGDRYGSAVDGVGDVNGDGLSDYIIGAPFAASTAGLVHVRSGANGAVLKSVFGLGTGEYWGSIVAGLGDLNGDGRGDYAFNGTIPGPIPVVYVMSGATHNVLFAQIQPPTGATSFPLAIAPAGDVNGDGTGDIAVAAAPSSYVFSGVNGALLQTLGGAGFTIAGLGDVNGDGASDIAVGNSSFTVGTYTQLGRVRVHSGATGSVLWARFGDGAFDNFGLSLHAVDDVNRDGTNDVLVGAPEHVSGAFLGSGFARLFSGTDGGILGNFPGSHTNESFGWSVGDAGDVDSDGVRDFLMGGYRYKVVIEAGRVAVYKGQMSGPAIGIKFCYCTSPGAGPCSNDATTPGGCKNSTGNDGVLDGYGTTSVARDDLFLVASGLPAGSVAVFFAGLAKAGGGFGVPYGNGRLCVSGTTYTFPPNPITDAAGTAIKGPGLTGGNAGLVGLTAYFQAWYQDPSAPLPCTHNFNLTQALEVTFTP
jgi:hypothetical protein